jgi:hypothetical protein
MKHRVLSQTVLSFIGKISDLYLDSRVAFRVTQYGSAIVLPQDSACAILQVAASMPSCQVLRDACEECCARHFDYCIVPPATEFRGLEVSCLLRILQHPDLCVTSEEKVLDAVMLWAANRDEIHGWDDANCHANNLEQDHLFGQREEDLESLLPLVHFPFISLPVLEMVGQILSSSVQGDVIFGFEWLMRRYLRNIFTGTCMSKA